MSLLVWAERLLQAQASPEIVDLHLKDTLAAGLLGLRTSEGQALAQMYARRAADPAERAAAMAAIARSSECDDIHLASCVTPGAIVIPVALALCDRHSDDDFNRAVCVGYAAGLSLGKAIGGVNALAYGVWPTLLAAPVMAAATASCLRRHSAAQLAHSIALALAGANGRVGRPSGTPSGRWFVLAEAVMKGIRASEAASGGFHGDLALLSRHWLATQAGHDAIDVGAFESAPTSSIADVGFKPFPIARQALNAVLAFQALLSKGLDLSKLERFEVLVPSQNWALLTRAVADTDRLSRLSNLGFQLACAAHAPELLDDPERGVGPDLVTFGKRVVVLSSDHLGADCPGRWPAQVTVNAGGERLEETITRTPFDHDAANLSEALNEKWRRLLSPQDADEFLNACRLSETDRRRALWKMIGRRVTMAPSSPG